MADRGLLFSQTATCDERFEAIRQRLVQQFQAYPRMVASITASTLQVLHVARDFESTDFAARMIEWRRFSGWAARAVEFPARSSVLLALGTGSAEFTDNMARYVTEGEGGTSRSVFHCFCDTLFNTRNRSCGGAPQLVGIIRKPRSAAITYGTIVDGQRFFLGAQVEEDASFEAIEWRNDLFELCDGRTMEKYGAAQSQPDRLRRT